VAGHLYLAMEYIHGKDLRAIIQKSMIRGRLIPPAVAVQIAVKICSALQYAHNVRSAHGTPLNIIHRDVSPSNIMVTFDGQVKLIDFGIAKAAGRSSLTLPGTIKGKIRYLSPEQVLGKDLDGRSDLFTLATSLWEATVGRHLFEGSAPVQVYEAVVKGPVVSPARYVPEFPLELERIVMRALAQNRDERYPDAEAMQRDLEAFASAVGIPLSDLSLAEFMADLYREEIQLRREGQAQGKSLLELLQAVAADTGQHEHDLDDVLALEDQRSTIPERPKVEVTGVPAKEGQPRKTVPQVSGPGLPEAVGQNEPAEPAPEQSEPPRKTLFLGSKPAADATPPGPRKTVLYGERSHPSGGRQSSRPDGALRDEAASLQATLPPTRPRHRTPNLAAGERVAITPKGEAKLIPRDAPQGVDLEASRATMMEEPVPGAEIDARPTLVESWSEAAREAAPSPPTDRSLDELWAEAGQPDTASDGLTVPPGDAAGQPAPAREPPSTAEDDKPPAGQPASAPGGLRAVRTRTGDWAQQATGERPAGTHPFFKETDGHAPVRELDEVPRNDMRRTLLVVAAIVVAAAVVVVLIWVAFGRRASAPAASAPTVAPPPPAPRSTRRVRLASVPPGARIYDDRDGQELGQTPLDLELEAGETRRVELRLPGYNNRSVVLAPGAQIGVLTLDPEQTPPPPTAAPRRPGRRKRPPPRGKTRPRPPEELKDPFGR